MTVHYFESLDSTNTYAKKLAAEGAPHGTAIVANTQTAGRGRLGRSFSSPAGMGVYMSIVLRPQCPPAELMHLTCAVGVAVCTSVEKAFGFRPGIKWINDLVVGNRKLGGILTELSISPQGMVDYAVVGIGINCNQVDFPEEIANIACSAATVLGKTVDRQTLIDALLAEIPTMTAPPNVIMPQYRANCVTLGKVVRAIRGDTCRNGTALEVLDDGALLVRFDDGSTEALNSGEVSVRGLWDYC
jgi:BirA family biotin operon repressor/biotin-[acetyl-CoA-carboxylase] ligase